MEEVDETLKGEKNKININNFIHFVNVWGGTKRSNLLIASEEKRNHVKVLIPLSIDENSKKN